MKPTSRSHRARHPILLKIWRKLADRLALVKYWHKSTKIAGPGFLKFQAGVLNPGAVPIGNGETLLLAKGQFCHWVDAVSDQNKFQYYLRGAPVVIILDDKLHVKSSYVIESLHNFPVQDELAIEDFRVFRYQSRILVNHPLIFIERRGQQIGYRECSQALSVLDPVTRSLTYLGSPKLDLPLNPKEKNWVYIEADADLYLFYSLAPYRVLKLVDASSLAFETIIDQQSDSRLGDIGGFGTLVSFSTNPVEYDAHHWLLVVHQVDTSNNERLYYQWGVLIEKATLQPAKITSTPLCSGFGARGRLRGIRYVMSAIAVDDAFILFSGEGDDHSTRMSLSRNKLEKMWATLRS